MKVLEVEALAAQEPAGGSSDKAPGQSTSTAAAGHQTKRSLSDLAYICFTSGSTGRLPCRSRSHNLHEKFACYYELQGTVLP